MSPQRSAIISALGKEREQAAKGKSAEVLSVGWEDEFVVLSLKPKLGRAMLKLDEQLEGSLTKWGAEFDGCAVIKMVDANADRVVLRLVAGSLPAVGETVWVFPNDLLTPLRDLWAGQEGLIALKRYEQSQTDLAPLHDVRPLPQTFNELRERQKLAVQTFAYRSAVIIGPPGTGKSYTVGALVAYLLTRFSKARVLIVGPTNVAVDGALLSVDDWLNRLGRRDMQERAKRVGAQFDARKYASRRHLLAPEVEKALDDYLLLEASEPPRAKVGEHIRWKERLDGARAALKSDVADTARSARIVATTVATAVRWKDALTDGQTWHFVICDEASQVSGPAAMMVASMGQQVIFAGDPQQLSPIVQNDERHARDLLTQTAFDLYNHSDTVRLNEQSRMAAAICQAVGSVFYGGDLMVCHRAARDEVWKKERSPFFVDGRELPRLCFQTVGEPATFSAKYGGFIRFSSAKVVEAACDELSGSYVDPDDVLVLTPFRAQRALLQLMLRRRHPTVRVSTVHRAQGSERTLVIFDPVDGGSALLSGAEGARLVNVAVSRAKAHIVVPVHPQDLANEPIAAMQRISTTMWNKAGRYATPFSFKVSP